MKNHKNQSEIYVPICAIYGSNNLCYKDKIWSDANIIHSALLSNSIDADLVNLEGVIKIKIKEEQYKKSKEIIYKLGMEGYLVLEENPLNH